MNLDTLFPLMLLVHLVLIILKIIKVANELVDLHDQRTALLTGENGTYTRTLRYGDLKQIENFQDMDSSSRIGFVREYGE